jgi:FixJ family two-component response regulator/two-component sensor histidine kinase
MTSAPPVTRKPIVVAVVEDDPLICQGLIDLLDGQGWSVESFATGEALLAAFHPGAFSCLLLDARLPGISGLDVLARLRAEGHRLPTLMITGASDIRTAVASMKAGALDFLVKPVTGPELIAAVTDALTHVADGSLAAAGRAAAAGRLEGLTPRQREVMHRILDGQANKNIAADLGLSQRTVENHRARIMRRTGSASLPELARLVLTASWTGESGPTPEDGPPPQDLAAAATAALGPLDDDQFRRFFDAVPMAILISAMGAPERIVYANPAFEALSGQSLAEIEGQPWTRLSGTDAAAPERALGPAIVAAGDGPSDWLGTFALPGGQGDGVTADVYVSLIRDEADEPAFRLAALVAATDDQAAERTELEETIRAKDMMILEIQHRVKNNLQMITALIRIEARNHYKQTDPKPLDRLEGRINAIQILYRLLSELSATDEIDLGVYLSEIASAVMHAHAVEGIRLELKVDAYPVSVNVALPTGLAANELLTNALKHAFAGPDGGTIILHSLADARGCKVVIADDGQGLPDGVDWPRRGSMGELIVRSLRQNARAEVNVDSIPGQGTRVTIAFTRAASIPETTG